MSEANSGKLRLHGLVYNYSRSVAPIATPGQLHRELLPVCCTLHRQLLPVRCTESYSRRLSVIIISIVISIMILITINTTVSVRSSIISITSNTIIIESAPYTPPRLRFPCSAGELTKVHRPETGSLPRITSTFVMRGV